MNICSDPSRFCGVIKKNSAPNSLMMIYNFLFIFFFKCILRIFFALSSQLILSSLNLLAVVAERGDPLLY